MVIRFLLKERIADREFKEKRKITLDELAKETGISRNTLSRIANTYAYNTTTDNLARLCQYFGCKIDQLIECVDDSDK